MRDLVERAGEMYADRTAYSFRQNPHDKETVKVSFSEMRRDVRALSSELLSRGLAGKHCAVIGKCTYSYVRVYFSLLSIGAVMVPLDRDWLKEDLAETVARAEAEYLIIDGDLTEKDEFIKESCNISSTFYLSGDSADSVDALVASGKEKFEKDPDAYFNAPIDANALALLVFTSGTTGKGKGVMLSQNNVLSDMSDVTNQLEYCIFYSSFIGNTTFYTFWN